MSLSVNLCVLRYDDMVIAGFFGSVASMSVVLVNHFLRSTAETFAGSGACAPWTVPGTAPDMTADTTIAAIHARIGMTPCRLPVIRHPRKHRLRRIRQQDVAQRQDA